MRVHTIYGTQLLALLYRLDPGPYPDGVAELPSGLMALNGEPIDEQSRYSVWSCTGDYDTVRFDSDWSVDLADESE